MAIKRVQEVTEALYSVNVNVVLTGSKKMTPEQQDALMTVGKVRVLIVDASDDSNVLLDAEAEAREFSTGSVGYGVQERECRFAKEPETLGFG